MSAEEEKPIDVPAKMTWRQQFDWWLPRIVAVAGVFGIGYIVYRIFSQDAGFSGGTGSNLDSALLVQANDRLLTLVQWTLGLVITVGGLLVGFGWFQSRSRYQEDRERMIDYEKKVDEAMRGAKTMSEQQAQLIDSLASAQSTISMTVASIQESLKSQEDEISRIRWAASLSMNDDGLHSAYQEVLDDAFSERDLRYALEKTKRVMDIGGVYARLPTIQAIITSAIDNLKLFIDEGSNANLSPEEIRLYSGIFDDLTWNKSVWTATIKQVIEWKQLVSGLSQTDQKSDSSKEKKAEPIRPSEV